MRFYEAMKLVEEGKKVMPKGGNWNKGFLVCANDGELVVWNENYYQECFQINCEWEEYIEPVE